MRLLSSFSPPPVNPPHMSSKTNSTVLFARNIVIVIAVMFVICGLLHLLVRYLIKKKRLLSSSNSHFQSSRFQESGVNHDGGGDAFETQLQQLFNLHDSGLDQDFIDALPVFSYKELMGLKEPFDCAVCLCEFTQKDSLRLLPLCSHAFHMYCIDTWLLSNSTCPLCRGSLFAPGFSLDYPVFEFNDSREENDVVDGDDGQGHFGNFKQSEGSIGNEKRVYPVRLGSFRATNVGKSEERATNVGKSEEIEAGETSNSNFNDGQGHFGHFMQSETSSGNEKMMYGHGHFGHFRQPEGSIGNEKRVYPVKLGKFRAINVVKGKEKEAGETSNNNVDARRCYSMGSYEYVVGNSELRVEYVSSKSNRGSFGNKDKEDSSIDGGNNGKKISNRSKGESFSVSKIWLWSKKDHNHQKGQLFSGIHMVNSSVNVSLSLRNVNNSHS